MFPQLNLIVTNVVILIFYSNEINGNVLDKILINKDSMVHQNIKSMDTTKKINPILTSSPYQLKQQSNQDLISKNNPKYIQVKRQGKFFTDLSFLTGLGIGSLATSAIIPSATKSSSNSILSSGYDHPAFIKTNVIDPTQSIISSSEQQLPLTLSAPNNFANVNDQTNPYYITIANNNLVNQAMRSIQVILDQLKAQYNLKKFSNVELTTESPLIINKRQIGIKTESLDELNQIGETSQISVIEKTPKQLGIFNCSTLMDIIREIIQENNILEENRQSKPSQSYEENEKKLTATQKPNLTSTTTISTTSSTTSATTSSKPQSNTSTNNFTYYSGNPHNVSGINLIAGPYPSTLNSYPNQHFYGPPVYLPESLHHHYQQQQQQHEYYQPEIIDDYPPDTVINSSNHFSSVSTDQWPIYPPYPRVRKSPRVDNDKLLPNKSGFIPSIRIG